MTQTSGVVVPDQRPRAGRGQHLFVIAAMAVVVSALGNALHRHAGLGLEMAVLVAAAAFGVLVAGHIVGHRRRGLSPLRTERRRIEAGPPNAGEPVRKARGSATGAEEPAAPSLRVDGVPAPTGLMHPAPQGAMAPPAPATPPPFAPPPPTARETAGAGLEGAAGRRAAPPEWRLRPGGSGPELTMPDTPAPSIPVMHTGDTAFAASPDLLADAPSPASGRPKQPAQGFSFPEEATSPPVPSSEAAQPVEPNQALKAGSVAADDPEELATMQALIEQLAARINAPPDAPSDSASARPDLPADAAPESGMTESAVAALMATAATMREVSEDAAPQVSSPKPSVRTDDMSGIFGAATVSPAGPPPPPLPSALPQGRLALIADAVTAGRIDLYLDPILALDSRKARHFEVSVRLRTDDGELISRDEYEQTAAGTGLLARIDSAKLTRSVKVAERLRERGTAASLFSSLAAESLADSNFLDPFADLFAVETGIGTRIVLSFAQSDVRMFAPVHWDAVTTMAQLGLRFALEEVSDLDMDFEYLKTHGFEFIKLDAAVFLEGMPTAGAIVPASDICRHLANNGLSLIVGRIEDEAVMAKIFGFGVLFGQGTLFGGARPVKVDVDARQQAAAA